LKFKPLAYYFFAGWWWWGRWGRRWRWCKYFMVLFLKH
jgi:hypothetical protein